MFLKWFLFRCIEFFLCIAPVQAQVHKLPALLQQVSENYSSSGTFQADFVQTSVSPITGISKKSTGKVWIKRPNKIRWETQSPESHLLVGNGKVFWFYTRSMDAPGRYESMQRESSGPSDRLIHALLRGDFSAMGLSLKQKAPAVFSFTTQDFGSLSQVTFEVDPKKKWIQKIQLCYKQGHCTEMILSSIILGKKMQDQFFDPLHAQDPFFKK